MWQNYFITNHLKSVFVEYSVNFLCGKVKNTMENEFHQTMKTGAALRKLAMNKYHQINWETPFYERIIAQYLEKHQRECFNNGFALDLGCGDGRFTKTLVDLGFKRIICVDSDKRLLMSLNKFAIDQGWLDRILIIQSDIDELNFRPNIFSVVLAIGVLYYLNERRFSVLKNISSWINNNGVFVLGEPILEDMIFRSLVFGGLDDAIENFDKRLFKEGQKNNKYRFSIATKHENESQLEKVGFVIVKDKGISLFHNFLRVLLVRGFISEYEIEKNMEIIKEIFEFLHNQGNLCKHRVWKCLKK